VLKVLNRVDAFRRPERFEKFLLACEADARGRTGFENRPYPQAEYFRAAWQAASEVDVSDLTNGGLSGQEIGKEIETRRQRAIAAIKKNQEPPK
jgi:tRNA nucleotidyltransferase (CCA-adding enzyme)